MRFKILTVAAAALIALLAACEPDAEAPPIGTPEPTPTPAVTPTPDPTPTPTPTTPPAELALDERCENEQDGYAIDYPGDWHVNEGALTSPCRFFDPEPFDVPEATEFIRAINIFVEPTRDEAILQGLRSEEVLLDEEVTVDGRPGHRLEVRLTRDLLMPEGTTGYHYVVEIDDERTLHASTYDIDEHDYESARELLDRMMESFEFLEEAEAGEVAGR